MIGTKITLRESPPNEPKLKKKNSSFKRIQIQTETVSKEQQQSDSFTQKYAETISLSSLNVFDNLKVSKKSESFSQLNERLENHNLKLPQIQHKSGKYAKAELQLSKVNQDCIIESPKLSNHLNNSFLLKKYLQYRKLQKDSKNKIPPECIDAVKITSYPSQDRFTSSTKATRQEARKRVCSSEKNMVSSQTVSSDKRSKVKLLARSYDKKPESIQKQNQQILPRQKLFRKAKKSLSLSKSRPNLNYRDYCLFISLTNHIFYDQQPTTNIYKAFVGKGNNNVLVKSTIKNRPWWVICENQNQANLFWTQSKNNKYIQDLEKVETQSNTSSKERNIQKYNFQISQLQSSNSLNEKIKRHVPQSLHKLLPKSLQKKPSTRTTLYQKQSFTPLKSPSMVKLHNHVQFNWNITNKKALYYNMKSYYLELNKNPFQFIPETYHVESEGDEEWLRFVQRYEELVEKGQKWYWIVKPGENTNRGCGIEVAEDLSQIRSIVRTKKTRNGQTRTNIIQKYLMPCLYNRRKFDIRCYMLVTSINGYTKCYWYEEGYIRTASKEFNLKNLKNRMIHLTNDAVQKYSESYGKFQSGNKLSFSDFQKYLNVQQSNKQKQGLNFFDTIYPKMISIAADTMKATSQLLNPHNRDITFEIFGLDYMIDQNFNTWLIEVNTNPCLELSCPLLARIIPNMLENAFRIAIDPIFRPPREYHRNKTLANQLFQSNKFSLIFDCTEDEVSKVQGGLPRVWEGIEEEQAQEDEEE